MAEEEKLNYVTEEMIAATAILKPPRTRTSIPLVERTAEWGQIFLVATGFIIGVFLYSIIFGLSLDSLAYGGIIGAAIAVALPALSPLPDESLGKWILLRTGTATAQRVTVNGRRVRLYIGVHPLKRVAAGTIRMSSAGIAVKANRYDERGYPVNDSSDKSSLSMLEEQRKERIKRQTGKESLKASTTITPRESAAPATKPARRKKLRKSKSS